MPTRSNGHSKSAKPTVAQPDCHLLDSVYQYRIHEHFCTDSYQVTRKLEAELNRPRFVFKSVKSIDPHITYRKINAWDRQNFIGSERESADSGWRRFSIIQVILLLIISDLKELGVDKERIAKIRQNLLNRSIERGPRFLQLEHFTCAVLQGWKTILVISRDSSVSFWTEHEFTTLSGISESNEPLVILPFHAYVQRMLKDKQIAYHLQTTAKGLLDLMPTEQERRILDVITKKEYREVTIKHDGDSYQVKSKVDSRGNFTETQLLEAIRAKQYQTVTVNTVDGKHLVLTQEESVKV